jgi:hypothetical protein
MTPGPIYVQIEHEHQVLDVIDSLKHDLMHAKKILHELYGIRTEENKSIREMQLRIQQIGDRITRIDDEVLS